MENNDIYKGLSDRDWDILLDEICKGNVVPIIGNELLKTHANGEDILINEFIIKEIIKKIDVDYSKDINFTRLETLPIWEKRGTDIYYETNKIVKDSSLAIPDAIERLFSIDDFKLILTTTFDTLIEQALEKKWGKGNFVVKQYLKGKNGEDIEDLDKPVLYQMFGKVVGYPSHSFVLTEDDLLEFLHYWLTENMKPKRLSNLLRDKHLLVLGCNYPNWLFRFFLQSMKSPLNSSNGKRTVANSKIDESLLSFLSRIKVEVYEDAEKFINELVNRWEKVVENRNITKIINCEQKQSINEVFVSYANEDEDIASEIVEILRKQGISVWFDKKELEPSDEFADKIKQNIIKSKAFIPLISKNVITEHRRFFKREWNWAIEETEWRNPTPFIYPITIDNVDIQHRLIPNKISCYHKIDFNSKDFEENTKKMVRKIRENLSNN